MLLRWWPHKYCWKVLFSRFSGRIFITVWVFFRSFYSFLHYFSIYFLRERAIVQSACYLFVHRLIAAFICSRQIESRYVFFSFKGNMNKWYATNNSISNQSKTDILCGRSIALNIIAVRRATARLNSSPNWLDSFTPSRIGCFVYLYGWKIRINNWFKQQKK